MITIISEEVDLTTDLVMEWLPVGPTNLVKRIQNNNFTELCVHISTDGCMEEINSTPKDRYWVRRGKRQHLPRQVCKQLREVPHLSAYLLKDDILVNVAIEQYHKFQHKTHHTGSYFAEKNTNKLTSLTLAGKVGFSVPATCVTNQKKHLQAFAKEHRSIITKDLRAPANISLKNGSLAATGVFTITTEDVETMADYFAPTLAQAYTHKQFEIRTFIFRESLFSMAIFSQNDEQTSVDFRNYNQTRPNRCVPFQLPEAVERKLLRFMKLAELDTGSVDLIYTPKGDYVFLEVNPMGQFHWLSESCNYYLEEFIANQLAQA